MVDTRGAGADVRAGGGEGAGWHASTACPIKLVDLADISISKLCSPGGVPACGRWGAYSTESLADDGGAVHAPAVVVRRSGPPSAWSCDEDVAVASWRHHHFRHSHHRGGGGGGTRTGQSRSKGRNRSRPTARASAPEVVPQVTPAGVGRGSDEYYTSGRRPRREHPTPTSYANGPPADVEVRVASLQRKLEAARAEASVLLTDPAVQSRWALRDKQEAKHPAANRRAPAQPPQHREWHQRVPDDGMSAPLPNRSPQPSQQPPQPPPPPPPPKPPSQLPSALSMSEQLVLDATREAEAEPEVEAALAGARLYLAALTGRDAGGGSGGGDEEERGEEGEGEEEEAMDSGR